MKLTQHEFSLRSALPADAVILTRWWNDGAVMAHAGFPLGLGTTVEQTCAGILARDASRGQLLILEINGHPVGEANFTLQGEAAEIGIKICEANYQNKGYGSQFLRMLLGYLFAEQATENGEPVQRIILDTNLNNIRAQHVYEKLGFRRVGVRKGSWQNQLGEWQSAVDYELTRHDFAPEGKNN